jgi:hypothetical protein
MLRIKVGQIQGNLIEIAEDFLVPAVNAGHRKFVNLVLSRVENWSDQPAWSDPNAKRNGSEIISIAETDSTPFVWVDEGVPPYSFGGPDYHMTFQHYEGTRYESYDPKTDVDGSRGSGTQRGPLRVNVQVIRSRDIRAREFTDKTIRDDLDEIIDAIASAIS